MTPRASLEIFEIEAEQVVSLDHVGVALADDAHQLFEHRALVHLGAAEQALEAGRIGDRDCDHAVALTRGGGKLEAFRDVGLDIDLHPHQVA